MFASVAKLCGKSTPWNEVCDALCALVKAVIGDSEKDYANALRALKDVGDYDPPEGVVEALANITKNLDKKKAQAARKDGMPYLTLEVLHTGRNFEPLFNLIIHAEDYYAESNKSICVLRRPLKEFFSADFSRCTECCDWTLERLAADAFHISVSAGADGKRTASRPEKPPAKGLAKGLLVGLDILMFVGFFHHRAHLLNGFSQADLDAAQKSKKDAQARAHEIFGTSSKKDRGLADETEAIATLCVLVREVMARADFPCERADDATSRLAAFLYTELGEVDLAAIAGIPASSWQGSSVPIAFRNAFKCALGMQCALLRTF